MRRLVLGVAALSGMAVLVLAAGFAVFVAVVDRAGGPVPAADGIVALTGGADRVETALRLLAAGKAGMLLVSGVGRGARLGELAHATDVDLAPLAPRITLGRTATTTRGNAAEAAEWATDHAFHALILVTADYHMPRAMLEMRRAMPDTTIHPLAVQPPGVTGTRRMRLLLTEYGKLLAAWLGLSSLVDHQIAMVHGWPVYNSVNG